MSEKTKSKVELQYVEYVPKELPAAGVLYVSKRFNVAAHICPCGCGTKIVTPLGPHEWSFSDKGGKPTLRPSIGSWQIPCQSHYWITNGEIEWSYQWTQEQIEAGRKKDQALLESYYKQASVPVKKTTVWQRLKHWLSRIVRRMLFRR